MEITLYNKNGKPVAYIADDNENSIYLWNGNVVAYVYEDKIYGWNGKHLGWFVDGIIYDLNGFIVGFTQEKCPVATWAEPAKSAKYAKPAKYAPQSPYARPALTMTYSNKDLEEFLKAGKI
jgi:hypothetical protein